MKNPVNFQQHAQTFVQSLWKYNSKVDNEHSFRTDLEVLLRGACDELNSQMHPRQEIKDGQSTLGTPDFTVINLKNLGTVGLVENKKVGYNLQELLTGKDKAQITKYRKRSENIILTNYHDWWLLRDGKVSHQLALLSVDEIQSRKLPTPEAITALKNLLAAFLSAEPKGISRTKDLAQELATRCHDLREFLSTLLAKQLKDKSDTRLTNMYAAFQGYVDSHLAVEDFADAFAQTLGYSLFLAKLNVPAGTLIDLYNVQKYIPANFPLIRALADFLKELEDPQYLVIKHRVEEVLGMMNWLHLPSILAELGGQKELDLDEDRDPLIARDPFIYFYEHFLKEYDSAKRKDRGVYYTPPSVVNFIVRGLNDILKTQFGIADGLADPTQVQILDFATGTGTFLHEAVQQMLEDPFYANNRNNAQMLVQEHILKNLYGFEYLIAPYTIAHLKLSQQLRDKGFELETPLNIFLTNTLDNPSTQADFPFMQQLKEESRRAKRVKDMPIRVIMGNPPYSVSSQNEGEIDDITKAAYAPEGEKKLNWDDYVKFIRFAHRKLEGDNTGIIGLITNNGFLNAITLRQMRNSLLSDFNSIYILNLHGNIGETTAEGRPDKNVFDIRVGVCITFLVKTEIKPKTCKVYYAALKASNKREKWKAVAEADMRIFQPLDVGKFNRTFGATRWAERFTEPLSLLVPQEDATGALIPTYGDFWGVTEIFQQYGSGVKTDRDELVINQDVAELETNMRRAFSGQYDATFKERFNITNSSSYQFADKLGDLDFDKSAIQPVLYRPFDMRHIYYKVGFTSRPAYEVMQHMLSGPNYGIMFCRQLSSDNWKHSFIFNSLVECCYVSNKGKEMGYAFPIFLHPPAEADRDAFSRTEREENFKPAFRRWLDTRYGKVYTPEQVLGYMYAVLHSPTFRSRYTELLKLDFPRLPFVATAAEFEALSTLGWELVQAHTMQAGPWLEGAQGTPLATLHGEGDNRVGKVVYYPDLQRLAVNETQYFHPIPPEAYAFTIGGYQVLEKYLKERKKAERPLGLAELRHLPRVVNILSWTHRQMAAIDAAWVCP